MGIIPLVSASPNELISAQLCNPLPQASYTRRAENQHLLLGSSLLWPGGVIEEMGQSKTSPLVPPKDTSCWMNQWVLLKVDLLNLKGKPSSLLRA